MTQFAWITASTVAPGLAAVVVVAVVVVVVG